MIPLKCRDMTLLVTEFIENTVGMVLQDAQLLYVGMDISLSGEDNRYGAYGIVTGLAGEWLQFHTEWKQLLNRHGLDYIRMSDAMSFRGAFQGKHTEWGSPREAIRDDILVEAATLIGKRLRAGGTSIDFADTEGTLPSEKVIRFKKALMFQGAVLRLLEEPQYPNTFLAFMCDDEQDVAPQFYQVLSTLKRQHKEVVDRIASLCFCNDTRVMQLQAADMVAYVLREERMGRTNPLGPILFREAVKPSTNLKQDIWLRWE